MGRPSLTTGEAPQPPRTFRVLVTSGVFEPGSRGGGPIRSVANIVDTVPDAIDVTLVTRDRDLGSTTPYVGLAGHWVRRGRTRVFYLDTGKPSQWLRLRRELKASPFDLLYVNSLFDPVFTLVPILAVYLRLVRAKAVLIAPRGQLSPGALSLKAGKKRFYLMFLAPFLRHIDVVWHAFAKREASEIISVLPWAQVVVNHNQVALPLEPLAPLDNAGAVRLVFVGRISVKKNLDLTLRALRSVLHPVVFDIYGPVEDEDYWAKCESIISQLPEHVRATYRGELAPGEVRQIFATYDAFVFPTLGENFGHVIAESLSASCPVLCSDETPWTSVLEAGGGFILRDLTTEALGRQLEVLAAMSPGQRADSRTDAGRAYRAWRREPDSPNILDQARISGSWRSRR